jgi:hypothetical protein
MVYSEPLGVPLLPSEPAHLHHRHADHADLGERLFDVIELERLDDRLDLLHACLRAFLIALR